MRENTKKRLDKWQGGGGRILREQIWRREKMSGLAAFLRDLALCDGILIGGRLAGR